MCGPATLTSYARGSTDERHLTLFVFVSRGSPLTCLSLCISLSLSLCLSRPPYPVACLTRLSHSSLSLSLRIRCLDTYRHDHPSLFSLYLSLCIFISWCCGGAKYCVVIISCYLLPCLAEDATWTAEQKAHMHDWGCDFMLRAAGVVPGLRLRAHNCTY